MIPLQGSRVRFLVRETRSCMPHSVARKKQMCQHLNGNKYYHWKRTVLFLSPFPHPILLSSFSSTQHPLHPCPAQLIACASSHLSTPWSLAPWTPPGLGLSCGSPSFEATASCHICHLSHVPWPLGQHMVWPYPSPVPPDLNTPGSQERRPALSPQSRKDTLLCHPEASGSNLLFML